MTATMTRPWVYERPWMYPKQTEAFFCPERYSVIEGSTKSGKTVSCMCWLAEQAMACTVPGRNYWWVAPIYPQARIAFRRLKRGLPPEVYTANETELTLTLANGAVLWFKGGDKTDSLYGEDVYAAVIDEASRVKEDAFHAVRSTLTQTRGPLRIIGNVKGRRNWAYQLARRAESGEPGMRYTKITARDAVAAGVLDAEEIEDARRTLPDAVFRELYLCEPSDDGGNPFGLSAIRACVRPLSSLPPAAWGIDLAKSHDWTVCLALDAQGHTCRFERWQSPWRETIARIEDLVGHTPALVDSTGVGDPILEALQRPYAQATGTRPGATALAAGRPNYEGFKFTAPSKQQLMEGLAAAIQQGAVGYPEGVIVDELDTFEYAYTRTGVRYSAPEGLHDDTVCALESQAGRAEGRGAAIYGWSGHQRRRRAPVEKKTGDAGHHGTSDMARTAERGGQSPTRATAGLASPRAPVPACASADAAPVVGADTRLSGGRRALSVGRDRHAGRGGATGDDEQGHGRVHDKPAGAGGRAADATRQSQPVRVGLLQLHLPTRVPGPRPRQHRYKPVRGGAAPDPARGPEPRRVAGPVERATCQRD